MQNCTTILGIIDMRQHEISYNNDCSNRYNIGHSAITLIMSRFRESGKTLEALKQVESDEVEKLFFPLGNIRRKEKSVMPD